MSKTPSQLQLNDNGELIHLLTLEGLPKEHILKILDTAGQFVAVNESDREIKKVPLLRGRMFSISFLKTLLEPELLLKLLRRDFQQMSSI